MVLYNIVRSFSASFKRGPDTLEYGVEFEHISIFEYTSTVLTFKHHVWGDCTGFAALLKAHQSKLERFQSNELGLKKLKDLDDSVN